jgi:hypothetical protein
MERPTTIQFPKGDLQASRNGHSSKRKAASRSHGDDADVRYAAALKLVQAIDRNLRNGTCHYYDTGGKLLNTLDEVIHAVLTDTLAAGKPDQRLQEEEALDWVPAGQLVA